MPTLKADSLKADSSTYLASSFSPARSRPLSPAALAVLFVIGLSGCGPGPYLEDDEGGPRQGGSLLGSHPDNLSQPYAQGTKVRITLYTGGDAATGWQLRSDNPAVLSVDDLDGSGSATTSIVADCTARGAGDTVLRMLDSAGSERHHAAVQVVVPDRLRVLAHGPLRLVEQNAAAAATTEVMEARVLTGSHGVFALVYYHGTDRAYGRGLVQFDPVPGVTLMNMTSSGAPTTEWLFVSPTADGDSSVALKVGGATLKTLPVSGVPDSQLGSFGLFHQRVDVPKTDQELWVQAQATDMNGRAVQGVYASWTLNGVAQSGPDSTQASVTGDLYRYKYADGNLQTLSATHGKLMASSSIAASKGTVYDTTYLGCAMGGRESGGGVGSIALLLALLGLARRRVGRREAGVA
jgi:hypothetical protein